METIGSDRAIDSNIDMQNEKIKKLEERIERLEALIEEISSK